MTTAYFALPFKLISAATTNATSVAAGSALLTFIACGNTSASPRFLKIYDKASAPVVGTDVPVMTFIIPGNATGAGSNLVLEGGGGALFVNGIALAITGAAPDNDTTPIGANEVVVSLLYTKN